MSAAADRSGSLRFRFPDPTDAEAFRRYVEEAYPVGATSAGTGTATVYVHVTLPAGFASELPYQLGEVGRRFSGTLHSVWGDGFLHRQGPTLLRTYGDPANPPGLATIIRGGAR